MKTDIEKPIPPILPRIEKYQELAYGLFLHWGLYSHLGRGEWAQSFEGISNQEYESLIHKFDAAKFDARAIARTAKAAGMRYIVLTTRHHEGFSLYDTRGLSSFDAPHSPAKRDLVREFVEGCRAEGVVPFFYHTTLDWRWDSANCSEADFRKYLDYLHASVEILCQHYGEIGGFWFDGNWSRPNADWNEDRLYGMIRRHQPDAIIINNTAMELGGGIVGHPEIDSATFEQGLPRLPDRRGWPKYVASEMCETTNGHWGICHHDFNFKSPATIIENLSACRKVGANYLFNIGPNPDGTLPAYESAVLEKAGEWIALCPDGIHEGVPVNIPCSGRDFLLRVGRKFYFFAHDLGRRHFGSVMLPKDGMGLRSIDGFPELIQSIRWVDNNRELRFTQSTGDGLVTIDCDGYYYGEDLVVRIAEISIF